MPIAPKRKTPFKTLTDVAASPAAPSPVEASPAAPSPETVADWMDGVDVDVDSDFQMPPTRREREHWDDRNIAPVSILLDRQILGEFRSFSFDLGAPRYHEGLEVCLRLAQAYMDENPDAAKAIARNVMRRIKAAKAAEKAERRQRRTSL